MQMVECRSGQKFENVESKQSFQLGKFEKKQDRMIDYSETRKMLSHTNPPQLKYVQIRSIIN